MQLVQNLHQFKISYPQIDLQLRTIIYLNVDKSIAINFKTTYILYRFFLIKNEPKNTNQKN